MIVIVCGLPATGKTVTANRIAKQISSEILNTDKIRKEIFEQGTLEQVLNSSTPLQFNLQDVFKTEEEIPEKYQGLIEEQRQLVYDIILEQVKILVLEGTNVVLDGTFYSRFLRERVYKIAKYARTKTYVVECTCPESIVEQRLKDRRSEPDTLSCVDKMRIYYTVKENYESPIEDGVTLMIFDTCLDKISVHYFNGDNEETEELITALKD
jgi:predicted kinase